MPCEVKLTMSNHRKARAATCAGFLLLTLLASPNASFGLGLSIPDQDAFATARGNAFVATANDPSAIFYNPAGISQLDGFNVSLGSYGVVVSDRFNGPSSSINSKTIWSATPQFFSTYNLSNYHVSFGLGIYTPYGFRMEWPNTAPFLSGGEEGQIDYFTAAGMLAWQALPNLSLAAGPTFNYSDADLKEVIPFAPGATFVNHFRGHATDAGYT